MLVVPPVRLTTVPGIDTAVFAFTTDIPFLDRWGAPLLIGPGSVTLAHTADEHAPDCRAAGAVDLYEGLARQLLGSISRQRLFATNDSPAERERGRAGQGPARGRRPRKWRGGGAPRHFYFVDAQPLSESG